MEKNLPLIGFTILHNVPLVENTLLKIACLVVSGAKVTVTNPSFMSARATAIAALQNDGITYVENIHSLRGTSFDFYLDCGAELYQALGRPRLGAVELTPS